MVFEVVGFSGGKASGAKVKGSILFLLKQRIAKGEQCKPVKFSIF